MEEAWDCELFSQKIQLYYLSNPLEFGNPFALDKSITKTLGAKMKKIITITILLLAQQGLAFDKEDSGMDFRQALLQSNKDYNDNRKEGLDEDNRRIDQWNSDQQETIVIKADIAVDPREVSLVEPEAVVVLELTMNN